MIVVQQNMWRLAEVLSKTPHLKKVFKQKDLQMNLKADFSENFEQRVKHTVILTLHTLEKKILMEKLYDVQ